MSDEVVAPDASVIARNKLADLIDACTGADDRVGVWKVMDAILDAGWRPPERVIETVEELDALPADSYVCINEFPSVPYFKYCNGNWAPVSEQALGGPKRVPDLTSRGLLGGDTICRTASVLWESGDPR